MTRRRLPLLLSLLLFASCGENKEEYEPSPAIRLTVGEVTHSGAVILVESIFCDEVYVIADPDRQSVDADLIISEGVPAENGTAVLTGLSSGTKYTVYGVGRKGDKLSSIQKTTITTVLLSGDLYPYERERSGAPFFADITLCPGGGRPGGNAWFSVPAEWDEERFAPHVSYSDSDGDHWLFEAFLAITGSDPDGNTFVISNSGAASAGKTAWENLAEYWAGDSGAFSALDRAIDKAARSIGSAPPTRYAVMVMPDPIQFARFSDKSSSTAYWGALDGQMLDFSRSADQVRALRWYIDLVREKFAALDLKHLELAGFYILSEELVAKPGGWNYNQKRWDQILPEVGEYLASCNEGLYWIPYLGADGCDMWRDLKITYSWLQPNRYWDKDGQKPMSRAISQIKKYRMGIELEFEYSMVESVMKIPGIMGPDASGNYAFTLSDVSSLRSRFREYMDGFRSGGLYGKERIALYSGSNAMFQLATSKENDDIAMYLELCHFISDNPLRRK